MKASIYATICRMVRGWQRVLLVFIALGVFLALVSPYVPDPLSIPGKNVVLFAIFLLAIFSPHALLEIARAHAVQHEFAEQRSPDRLALNCSRLI